MARIRSPHPRRRAARSTACALLLASLLFAGAAPSARPTSVPPANQPVVGPQGTLEAVTRGYRDRSADSVLVHYTADFRFHALGDSLVRFMSGKSREQEQQVLRNMFEGVIRDGDTLRAPVDSLGVVMDGFAEGVDAEHPDSSQHYRVVVVGRFEIGFRAGAVRMSTRSRQHVFHMVRADAAVLVPGQSPDPGRWYVRRWLEDVSGVLEALRQQQGDCGEPQAPAPGHGSAGAGAAAATLAIRPQANPACANLRVTCEFPGAGPGHVEVYDVSGRRVNRRDVTAAAPGRVEVDAGAGTKLLPGPYWVRLSQGTRAPVTRMVMVAR